MADRKGVGKRPVVEVGEEHDVEDVEGIGGNHSYTDSVAGNQVEVH